MCGIVGVFEYGRTVGGLNEGLIARMRDTLAHRGPDGAGVFVSSDRKVGLGHRRLSIVDPAGGAQPMTGAAGLRLVFNGEIYNYPSLRTQLEQDGARFQTRCDTEVILHLYERLGECCVEYLTGMFAFALWDQQRQRLLFARDPIGEKPLYWTDCGGVLLLGSEIKALLAHPAVSAEVNEPALGPYLAHLVVPAPETCFRGIFKLSPGCLGWCDSSGVSIRRYVAAGRPRHFSPDDGAARTRVRELLEESVRARLMSDVPVGILLSGGVDSTAIMGLLADHATELAASFTVGFPGHERYDEREKAARVAAQFGTAHHDTVLTEEDALNLLPALIHHQDEPIADPVCVPLHAVCQLARTHGVKVVLAGEGADELFWGYNSYQRAIRRWWRLRAALALPRPVLRAAARVTSVDRAARRRENLDAIAQGRPNPVHMPVGLTRQQRVQILRDGTDAVGWSPTNGCASDPALQRLVFDTQEYEFQVRLPELLLMRIDRFSMANSVEARVPFLDPALVDYVYALPLDMKVNQRAGKVILREAVSDILPRDVAGRPKQGFGAPTSRWFLHRHGTLLWHLMTQDALRRYFNADYLATLTNRASPNDWEMGQILWPILNFGLWHKYWIEQEPIDDLLALVRSPAEPAVDPAAQPSLAH